MISLYLQIALVALIAGTLDTVAGFGGALLLLPVLVLIAGGTDAVLLAAIIPLGWNIPRLILLRGAVDWRSAGLFALGVLPGALVGGHILASLDPDTLRTAIGAMLILFGAYYVLRLYLELPEPRGLGTTIFPVIGLVAGIMGSILGAGDGQLAAGALGGAGMSVRDISATGGAIGGISSVSRLISYAASGLLHEGLIIPGAIGVAAACAGTFLGIRFSGRSRDSTLELLIGSALVLAGIRMVL